MIKIDKYLVIWANILEEFDVFDEAMSHAKTQVFQEKYCNSAMIVSIHKDDEANITTADVTMVTWWYGATWTVTELGVF